MSAAELARVRADLGCEERSDELACTLLARFTAGAAPRWAAGSLGGAAVTRSGTGPCRIEPALLTIRGEGSAVEAAWAVVPPADPGEATRLAAMAADVLADHRPPMLAVEPWPGLIYRRPHPTDGPSARLDPGRPAWIRRSDRDLVVLDLTGPWLAVHREGAAP